MEQATLLEVVLKRDRVVVAAGLAGVVAVAWAYVFYLAWYMRDMAMNSLDATMCGVDSLPWPRWPSGASTLLPYCRR
jgi:predicted metal-binding membrane protein